jgi:hypothetical protein
MSLAVEKPSVAVRPFYFYRNHRLTNLFLSLAPKYTCYRDSANQPQCKSPTPVCTTPSYVVCNGDNFCCRTSVLFASSRSPLVNFLFSIAPNYTCYRDSLGQPQCRPTDPVCTDQSYVPCSGENFCCRMSIVFVLNRSVSVNRFHFLAPKYTCYRDSADKPQCKPPTSSCSDPNYSVCSGENFCCRTPVRFVRN